MQPTGIAGCAFWYKADSLVLNNGDGVTFWQDLSGSGNHLQFPVGNSSTTHIPTFVTNSINGLPAINFATTQSLQTVTSSASLNCKGTNYTSFVVFSTTGINEQVIFANGSTTAASIDYSVEISGTFAFANNGGLKGMSSGIPSNQYILRHDRFKQSDGSFWFGYFGVDISSGNFTLSSTSNQLSVGFTSAYGVSNTKRFAGNIAEIVGYDKALSDSDVAAVNSYLTTKYFPPPTPPSSIFYFHLPSDISGLFAWYRSTSIGVTGIDGSPVQYWPDDSGSGNNLSATLSQSGQWVFPTFYRNIINGYPVVRFINGSYYSYLVSDINTNKLAFSSDDLSTYCVFSTTDNTTEQSIYTIDDTFNDSVFNIGLNHAHNNSFYFGAGNTSSYSYLPASSTTLGFNLYDTNKFMVRSDRFHIGDSGLIFGRNATELASGTINTDNVSSRVFRLGYSKPIGTSFYGDVAEIITYGRKLTDIESSYVNNYLIDKYMPGNVGSLTVFIYSSTNTGIYKDIPLYTYGSNLSVQKGNTLYVGSSSLSNSGTTLYSLNTQNNNSGTPLYMTGNFQTWPPITLFMANNTNTISGMSLYVGSTTYINNNTSIYTSGSAPFQNHNITLYMGASTTITSGISLYSKGTFIYNSGTTLFTPGSLQQWPPITLYTTSTATGVNNPSEINLYIKGLTPNTSTDNFPLYTNATPVGTNGLYVDIPLYMEAGKTFQSLPLYLGVSPAPVSYPPSGTMALFVGTPFITGVYSQSTTLYLNNNVSGINSFVKRLYVKGDGGLNGGSISNNNMPLYLYNNTFTPPISSVPGQTNSYFYNNYSFVDYFQPDYFDTISSSGISKSLVSINNNITMYMNGVSSLNSTGNNINLYQYGSAVNNTSTTLYMSGGNPNMNSQINTYIRGF